MAWLLPPLPPTFAAALRDVKGKRPESRVAAAERLGRASDDERGEAIAGLLDLARDAHPSVRATAIASLGALAAEDALPLLLEALDDPAPEVRELAAVAAAQVGGPEALTALVRALAHKAPEVRFQAVAALAELSPERAAESLPSLITDPDPEVRAQVVTGLASLREPHLVGHIAFALDDDSPAVRLEGALALATLGDRRGETVLLEALERRDRPLEVIEALGGIGSTKAIPQLVRLAESFVSPLLLKAAAGACLYRLDDPRGVVALRRCLTAFRSHARSYAVDLVREHHVAPLVPDLVSLAERLRGTDPLTLVDALSSFTPEHDAAKRALQRLASRPDQAGERAQQALGLTTDTP